MSRRTWSIRSLVVGLVVSSTAAVGVVGAPAGSVSATNQERVTATSPTTGVTYSAIHSCVAQMPSATATQPAEDVFVQLQYVRNGDVIFEVNDRVDFRSDDNRLKFQRSDTPFFLGIDDVTFRFRDVFVSDGLSSFGPVFMTITPQPCPDYGDEQRGAFEAIAPQRVLDTRPDQSINFSGSKPGAGASVKIAAADMPGRPANAVAVSATITMVQPDRRGFAQAYPTGSVVPGSASTVNSPDRGVNIANGAVVPFGADGSISLFTSGGSHLLVDINGYFVKTATAVAGGRLESIDPARLFDSRAGSKPAPDSITTVDLTVLESGLPPGATAAVVNITAARTTAPGFVQAAASGSLAVGESSVLNVTGVGQSVAGLSIVPVSSDGKIDLYTRGGADLIVDLFGWFTGPDAEVSGSGLFVPLTPERVFDSRRATSMNPNTFTDEFSGCCSGSDAALGFASLQDKVSAVFLNATAIGFGVRGFIRIGGDNNSTFSTVNHAAQGAIANAALVPIADGDTRARLFAEGARVAGTRPALAADITGYFTK
ncbi:MAG: hypothetical protein AB8G14_11110 [Ilumatobacter sp.]